ncbi:MAG TPA: dihydrofolate reductase family protein [Trueperaceae bacterium]|nr:dihydrofolate reductase family protein [Trueperaceae bacterium]
MARLVYGLMQSLDGYVDHARPDGAVPPPGPELLRHFTARTAAVAGSLYGRRVYELMRYWEEDRPEWDADERAYAAAWRATPRWVASRTLSSVGPNAALIAGDLGANVGRLKAEVEGDIEVAGPALAGALTELGLIDEYQLYLRPYVLGGGTPFFASVPPPLRLVAHERVGEDAVRLTYVPA